MLKAIIIILLTYLINVAIVNFIQFLVNLTFNTNFEYNVWFLAILFIIGISILNSNKRNFQYKKHNTL